MFESRALACKYSDNEKRMICSANHEMQVKACQRCQKVEIPEWLNGPGCNPGGFAFVGSNPSLCTIASVAQLVEHLFCTQAVEGSRPSASSKLVCQDKIRKRRSEYEGSLYAPFF